MSNAKIILVEDNDGDVLVLEKAIEARGISYQLIRFEDGEQAIEAITKDAGLVPDLILLDLNVPRLDGFDVLCRLRTIPRVDGTPNGIFTSSVAAKDRSHSAMMGADRFIHKPSVLDKFLEQVGAAVEEMLGL